MTTEEKQVMIVGVDDSEHSLYALEWTLDHFFTPYASNPPFKLVIVHAKPSPAITTGLSGPGAAEVLPYIEADLKKLASIVIQKAQDICNSKSVPDVLYEVGEGDGRNVLCDAVEIHHASILVVGSHGYGAIKRPEQDSDGARLVLEQTCSRLCGALPCSSEMKRRVDQK